MGAKPRSKPRIPKVFSLTRGCRPQCKGLTGTAYDNCLKRCSSQKKKAKKVPKGCPRPGKKYHKKAVHGKRKKSRK